jgi:hypothetical protein
MTLDNLIKTPLTPNQITKILQTEFIQALIPLFNSSNLAPEAYKMMLQSNPMTVILTSGNILALLKDFPTGLL